MLGPHTSDPGSSPGGGKHCKNCPFPKTKTRSCKKVQAALAGHIGNNPHCYHWNAEQDAGKIIWAVLGIEPRTSRTRSENHALRFRGVWWADERELPQVAFSLMNVPRSLRSPSRFGQRQLWTHFSIDGSLWYVSMSLALTITKLFSSSKLSLSSETWQGVQRTDFSWC